MALKHERLALQTSVLGTKSDRMMSIMCHWKCTWNDSSFDHSIDVRDRVSHLCNKIRQNIAWVQAELDWIDSGSVCAWLLSWEASCTSNLISSWFSAPPTTRMMSHYITAVLQWPGATKKPDRTGFFCTGQMLFWCPTDKSTEDSISVLFLHKMTIIAD